MKTKIPFYPQLAMRAWQKPDEHGISYELYTKCGYMVFPRENTNFGRYPFIGRVRSPWNSDVQMTQSWTADGYLCGWTAPMHLDLELFKITNND